LIYNSPRAPKTAFLALIRHARAVRASSAEPDSERELSPEGRASFEVQLARLESMGFACDNIWTSPWSRARATAELLGARLKLEPREREGLCSDPDTQAGLELIAEASAAARSTRVVLVGHQPWLAQIAQSLGAADVRDIECGEVVWLTERSDRKWTVAARLYPS
jgi:phosphohistidine phosphatase